MAKRADTAATSIAMSGLVMNFEMLLMITFFALYLVRLLLPLWLLRRRYQPDWVLSGAA